jgi:hypothetical protein
MGHGDIELRPRGNSSVPPPPSADPTNSAAGADEADSDGLLGRGSRVRAPSASAVWLKARIDGSRRIPWRVPATIGLCVVVGVAATSLSTLWYTSFQSYLADQAEVHQNRKDADAPTQTRRRDAVTEGPDALVVRAYATAASPPPPPPPPPLIAPPLRVLFVGNSFTYGPKVARD